MTMAEIRKTTAFRLTSLCSLVLSLCISLFPVSDAASKKAASQAPQEAIAESYQGLFKVLMENKAVDLAPAELVDLAVESVLQATRSDLRENPPEWLAKQMQKKYAPGVKEQAGRLKKILGTLEDKYTEPVDWADVREISLFRFVKKIDPCFVYIPNWEVLEGAKSADDCIGNGSTGLLLYKPSKSVFIGFSAFPGSEAGVKAGMILLEYKGQDISGMTLQDVAGLLGSGAGGTVGLALKDPASGEVAKLAFTRVETPRKRNTAPVSYGLENGIFYLKPGDLASEQDVAAFQKSMEELAAKGMGYLILDLRGDFRFAIEQARPVMELFIPKGEKMFSVVERAKTQAAEFVSGNGKYAKLPLTVLADRESPQGAELLAASVKAFKRGLVAGEQTRGNLGIRSTLHFGKTRAVVVKTGHVVISEKDYKNCFNCDEVETSGYDRDLNLILRIAGQSIEESGEENLCCVIPDISVPEIIDLGGECRKLSLDSGWVFQTYLKGGFPWTEKTVSEVKGAIEGKRLFQYLEENHTPRFVKFAFAMGFFKKEENAAYCKEYILMKLAQAFLDKAVGESERRRLSGLSDPLIEDVVLERQKASELAGTAEKKPGS
jgi:C-terminal processing protease CtpA/Prc